MKLILLWIAAIVVFPMARTNAAAQASDSEVQAGIDAYRKADYAEALRHFQAAKRESKNGELAPYLAATVALQFIPADTTVGDVPVEDAIAGYKGRLDSVVEDTGRFKIAMRIGYLYLHLRDFESSRTYYRHAVDLDVRNPEVQFAVGVVDWAACYEKRFAARSELSLDPTSNLDAKIPEQKRICDNLKASNTALIEEGIDSLKRVLDSRPDTTDAKVFLSLMHREKADVECDDPAARKKDLQKADEWLDKALPAKPVLSY